MDYVIRREQDDDEVVIYGPSGLDQVFEEASQDLLEFCNGLLQDNGHRLTHLSGSAALVSSLIEDYLKLTTEAWNHDFNANKTLRVGEWELSETVVQVFEDDGGWM